MFSKLLPSLGTALGTAALLAGLGLAPAHAAPTGPVNSTVFSNAGLNASDYTYIGSSTADFTATGTGVLELHGADYYDTVGLTTAPGAHPQQSVQLFSTNSAVGSHVTIDPTFSPFAFYFTSSGSGGYGPGADSAVTLYSDGVGNSDDGGQANLAIYKDAATNTYAMFFDDGGPSGTTHGVPNDDNDYNDLVVTYQQTGQSVPEPASLALLGGGLLGLGMARRRKTA